MSTTVVDTRISIAFAKKVYLIILSLAALWSLAVIMTPVMSEMGGIFPEISAFMYSFFSRTCHQEDVRSFFIFGGKLGVCSRCSMIYFAFLLGTLVYPFTRKINNTNLPSLWLILSVAGLMFIDAVLDVAGILNNTYITRSITGFFLGIVLPFYLIPGFIIFFHEINTFIKNR